jgi:hypothetical protein
MHDNDLLIGQLRIWIILSDLRVVPVRNLAQLNIRQNVSAEAQIFHTRNIEHRHHRTKHRGNVNQLHRR